MLATRGRGGRGGRGGCVTDRLEAGHSLWDFLFFLVVGSLRTFLGLDFFVFCFFV